MKLLQQKHLYAADFSDDVLMTGVLHPIIFEEIDDLIKRAALKTKGGSGPSEMDADGWRRINASNHCGKVNIDLRRAFADMIKKICVEEISVKEVYLY